MLAPLHLITLRILGIPIVSSLYSLRDILALQFAPPASTSAPETTPVAVPGHRPSYSRSLSRASLPPQADERPGPRRRTSMRRLLKKARGQRQAWMRNMARIVLALSTLIAVPALSWYVAMPLTAVTGERPRIPAGPGLQLITRSPLDVTAIYNCFAFVSLLVLQRTLRAPR